MLQWGYHCNLVITFRRLVWNSRLPCRASRQLFFLKAFLTIFFRILVMCSTERLTFCLRVLLAFCHPVLAKRFCCSVLIAKHAHAIANCMRKRRNNTIIYCSIGQGNMNIWWRNILYVNLKVKSTQGCPNSKTRSTNGSKMVLHWSQIRDSKLMNIIWLVGHLLL